MQCITCFNQHFENEISETQANEKAVIDFECQFNGCHFKPAFEEMRQHLTGENFKLYVEYHEDYMFCRSKLEGKEECQGVLDLKQKAQKGDARSKLKQE